LPFLSRQGWARQILILSSGRKEAHSLDHSFECFTFNKHSDKQRGQGNKQANTPETLIHLFPEVVKNQE
jgi:hypothetical protein